MKKSIRHYYLNTNLGYYIMYPVFRIHELLLRLIPDEPYIQYKFKKILGYRLNLNNPRTFNEKISFLKLHDRSAIQTVTADKYLVREFIKEKIGEEYLIPLVLQTKNVKDILPEKLPDYPVIIKTNHNSSGGIIVKNKNGVDWKAVRSKMKKLLRENYYYFSREWQYKNIEPRVIIEKLLTDSNGNIPADYKMHCFNGNLIFTQVDLDRYSDHRRNLYNVDWKRIPCRWKYENGDEVLKPKMYAKMKKLAEKIAADFTYLRVDFYSIGDSIFFGELTLHPGSGALIFYPQSYDKKFGQMLDIDDIFKKVNANN